MQLGLPHTHFRVTDSTNLRALDFAVAGCPSGTTVTASEQLAGRGRQGRDWHAPPDSALLVSFVLHHPPQLLSLRAGIAVAATVEQLQSNCRAELKWPNDVLLDDKKVSGILIQAQPQNEQAVLGIGLNTAVDVRQLPKELQSTAATLGLSPQDNARALELLTNQLELWLPADTTAVIETFNTRDALRGKTVQWDGGQGVAEGISQTGSLKVRSEDKLIELSAGEVHLSLDH